MMALVADLASMALITAGCVFFLAGTVGLLRFPDVYCRLHALTKADNLGLGFVALGLVLQAPGMLAGLRLLLIWLLALAAAATVCHVLARRSLQEGVRGVSHPSPPTPGGASSVNSLGAGRHP